MGTRAVINIEGLEFASIYKHYDGYPEATLKFLMNFNRNFSDKRGSDPSYKFAQLLRETIRSGQKYELDMSEFTGWGVIEPGVDVGQEFEYDLLDNGNVEVKEY